MATVIAKSPPSTEVSRKGIASPHWQRTPAGQVHAAHMNRPEHAQKLSALPSFGQAWSQQSGQPSALIARSVAPRIQRNADQASKDPAQNAGRKQRPDQTPPAEAAEIGKEALQTVGYEKLIEQAIKVGLVKKVAPEGSAAKGPVQRMVDTGVIQRLAGGPVRAAMAVLTRYAVTAGVTSQLDTPAPGPADAVALGILVVGLIHAGVVLVSSSRARSIRCRCSARPFENRNPPPDCPSHVEGVGIDRGSCQANAKNTAPQHCRAFYGHCYIRT
jgi:hypothetical protein